MYDVITIGSAFLDVLVKSQRFKIMQSKEFLGGVALCEAYGGKMEADEIQLASGGGGTNSAVSFARKKLKTAVIVEMGVDAAGKMIQSELLREHVETGFVVAEEGEQTGVSVILISGDAGRSVMSHRGASRMLTHKDIPWKKLNTQWLYVTSLGGRLSLLEELCTFAKQKKIKIAINPGASELRQPKRLMKCIRQVDVLFLNQEEATMLTGTDYSDMKIFRSESCLIGPTISVITAGKNGGKICSDGECIFYEGKDTKPSSSLGAGDAFGSGFIAALIHEKSIQTAMDWGQKNAESVIKYLSAKEGLLRLSELSS